MTEIKQGYTWPSDDFCWISEVSPELSKLGWEAVAAEAGAIIANDVFDEIRVGLFPDCTPAMGWNVHVLMGWYTDLKETELPAVSLDNLLGSVDRFHADKHCMKDLIGLLRRHADRLEGSASAESAPTATVSV